MDKAKVLKSYRGLIRASQIAFKNDDVAFTAARNKIRQEYIQNIDEPLEKAELLKKLQMAKDVARLLKSNVVQGVPNGEGRFKLGIHQYSELGDNSKTFGKSQGGCCRD
ncbi:Mzm1 protein [Starmerella bacillaris]|mgnify:CR=1 FL=1|uniref:Mitochondrial zinc maintenance protein 1, mitochondrial n=1 Tax=Starmerella bacillaris TaxID=1247836 RepID=A0AAV5RHP0_STABA|nr:Mzm1 protein [Starmerella bacillaris]